MLAELLRGDLVRRDTCADSGTFGLYRALPGQEGRTGAGVVAGTVAARAPVDVRQAAQDCDVVPQRLQGRVDLAELEVSPFSLRRPLALEVNDAVRHIDEPHPQRLLGSGRSGSSHRRRHRIQPRERDRHAKSSEHFAAGQGSLGQEGHSGPILIWNGMLCTTATTMSAKP